jgi:hypothetical protein
MTPRATLLLLRRRDDQIPPSSRPPLRQKTSRTKPPLQLLRPTLRSSTEPGSRSPSRSGLLQPLRSAPPTDPRRTPNNSLDASNNNNNNNNKGRNARDSLRSNTTATNAEANPSKTANHRCLLSQTSPTQSTYRHSLQATPDHLATLDSTSE